MNTIKILNAFFGRHPGQTLREFADELKQLTKEEKRELAALAAAEPGVEFTPID